MKVTVAKTVCDIVHARLSLSRSDVRLALSQPLRESCHVLRSQKYLVPSLLAALLVAVFASCGNQKSAPQQIPTTHSATHAASQMQGDYLPLAKGNWWKYRKRVSAENTQIGKGEEHCPIFTYEEIDVEDARIQSTATRMSKPGDSFETYSVTSDIEKTDDGYMRFEVEVKMSAEADSPFLFRRDGRYEDAKKVLWVFGEGRQFLRPDGRKAPTVYKEHVFKDVSDDLLRKPRTEPWHEAGKTQGLAQHIVLLHLAQESCEVTYAKPDGDTEIRASTVPEVVNVPAGEFARCIWTSFKVKNVQSSSNDKAATWSRTSYFAPSVGLVKELQTDSSGRVTYELDLLEYHVGP